MNKPQCPATDHRVIEGLFLEQMRLLTRAASRARSPGTPCGEGLS